MRPGEVAATVEAPEWIWCGCFHAKGRSGAVGMGMDLAWSHIKGVSKVLPRASSIMRTNARHGNGSDMPMSDPVDNSPAARDSGPERVSCWPRGHPSAWSSLPYDSGIIESQLS